MLLGVALAFDESPQMFEQVVVPPGLLAGVRASGMGAEVESLCRRIMEQYAPAKPTAFTAPEPGTDPTLHTARENDRMFQALESRRKFEWALLKICQSEEIFRPRTAGDCAGPRSASKRSHEPTAVDTKW
jgi:hypothetical protein